SSREHAPLAIKAAGISCVIAKTFARIFYRNAINIGLPILECPELVDEVEEGDRLNVVLDKGEIINYNKGKAYRIEPLPEFIQEIIKAGGLIPYIKKNR
ncbi:MAG: 3-isopropylmalate dehydratase small subunit, partial [Clostridiaceae bacterium]|nr:3-isopropylmalate dehydratase small subunit [Clostridiaceae bacterium]